ncbi:MAG: hypothetical protein HY746_06570 [Elusimicrobia bacterium]|nr:hypothetical protein [Elusimicrobiota bacterium]
MSAKKRKKDDLKQPEPLRNEQGASGQGYIIIAVSIMIIGCGYFLLYRTDPEGSNLYSNMAPFALIAGYSGLILGINRFEL